MKIRLLVFFLFILHFEFFSQTIFTSRKGSKFFPGHYDIAITVDNKNVKYELFNHWYSWAYYSYREITIPLDSLNAFNQNDSVKIQISKKYIKLVDSKYKLQKKIRHKSLCTSVQNMRKISFACNLVRGHQNLRHFELYDWEDLKLSEDQFKIKVSQKFKEKIQ